MKKVNSVTIIVPVYGDWPSLKECIESIITHVDSSEHKVMFVNDCGPDADEIESKIKKKISGKHNFFYFRNQKNLGFLQNCNNAVTRLDKTKNSVLLLNSDAKLTEGALGEMLAVLNSDEKIGAVSPRSNNATICTVPLSAASQKGIPAEASYRLFKKISPKMPQKVIVPTAHGFCMLIRRSLIDKYGLFDEVFGKGYGEEVDLCQRIRSKGYKCALANHAFVFHQEARSFSLEAKAKLLEVNNEVVWKRWPNYRQEVREYMKQALETEAGYENGGKIKSLLRKIQNRLIT